jgi:phage terminase Nu1 subunit (DNA packaging protein)
MRDKTTADILETFDIKRNTLQQWIKKGLPYTKAKGKEQNKFDEGEVASWLKEKRMTATVGRPIGPMSEQLAAAKLRHLLAIAEIHEMKRDQQKGTLVEKSEAERSNVTKFTVIRNKLLGMPSAVAPSITGLDAPDIERELEDRIREILTELSRA